MSRNLILGGLLSSIIALAAVISFVWTPFDHAAMDIPNKLQGPGGVNWLGTDQFGRDILSVARSFINSGHFVHCSTMPQLQLLQLTITAFSVACVQKLPQHVTRCHRELRVPCGGGNNLARSKFGYFETKAPASCQLRVTLRFLVLDESHNSTAVILDSNFHT